MADSPTPPRPIVVFGSRVRDVTVDVDLPDLYRVNPETREIIRFEGNDPILKIGTQIKTVAAGQPRSFEMLLEEGKPPKKDGFYTLKPGDKYQLLAPPGGRTAHDVTLTCRGFMWGGGGINLAVTLRALSNAATTPVTYVDTARPCEEQAEWQNFWSTAQDLWAQSQSGGDSIRRLVTRFGEKMSPPEAVRSWLIEWLQSAGERGYRNVARLLAAFDPLESIELFLTLHHIDFALFRAATAPSPLNLVFGAIREVGREFTNKIIFRGWRECLSDETEPDIGAFLAREIPRPGLIVIDTVYDRPLFNAAVKWAKQQQAAEPCPVVLCLTEKNMKHLSALGGEAEINTLKNLYMIFNDDEFGGYSMQHRETVKTAAEFLTSLEKGIPQEDVLRALLRRIAKSFPQEDQSFVVTLGPRGAIGVTHHSLRVSGSYAVPEKRVYGTSGCGDAFAAGVALYAYHRHNHDQIKSPGLPTILHERMTDLERIMQLGTATAYAKATSPTGIVTSRDVKAVLDNAYLPFQDGGEVGAKVTGPMRPPPTATMVGLAGLLPDILNG